MFKQISVYIPEGKETLWKSSYANEWNSMGIKEIFLLVTNLTYLAQNIEQRSVVLKMVINLQVSWSVRNYRD
jgi:hypothetical protein